MLSKAVDSIHNLLNFILGLWDVKVVPRRFDQTFTNGSKCVRITNMFNGHWNKSLNYQGIYSLTNANFRDKLKSFFARDELPNVMIMNSRTKKPIFLYRKSIATRGYAKALSFNSDKMEPFNHIMLEKLRERNMVSMVVDDFDLTYAWHYDNNCSDGVHYGEYEG
eukprot:Gb_03296 [translate_table: standard]